MRPKKLIKFDIWGYPWGFLFRISVRKSLMHVTASDVELRIPDMMYSYFFSNTVDLTVLDFHRQM